MAITVLTGLTPVSPIWSDSQTEPLGDSSERRGTKVYFETDMDRPLGERRVGAELRDARTGFQTSSTLAATQSRQLNEAQKIDTKSQGLLNALVLGSRRSATMLSQGDRWVWGQDNDQAYSFGFNARSNAQLLESSKHIPEADLKIGPLFIDVQHLEFTTFHQESWNSNGKHRSQDHVLASLGIESSLRVFDTLYLSIHSNLSYDFVEERFYGSAHAGSSASSFLGSFATFSHKFNHWEVSALQRFDGYHTTNLYQNLWFEDGKNVDDGGFHVQDSSRYVEESLDHRSVFFNHRLTGAMGRHVLDDQWYLTLQANRDDYWHSFNFDSHAARNLYRAELAYRGSKLMFAPIFSYEALSYSKDRWLHRAQASFYGRLLESVTWDGSFGYAVSDPDGISQPYWETQVRHQFSMKGWHSLSVGQNFEDQQFQPVTTFQNFARYSAAYRVTDQTHVAAFYQLTSNSETWDSGLDDWGMNDPSRNAMGFIHYWRVMQDAELQNGVYVNWDSDTTRYSYLFQANHRFSDRVSLQTYYRMDQYEADIDESVHHVGLTLRKTF